MWCDAILVLIQMEWPKARAALVAFRTQSVAGTVQAWLQAAQVQVRTQPSHGRSLATQGAPGQGAEEIGQGDLGWEDFITDIDCQN